MGNPEEGERWLTRRARHARLERSARDGRRMRAHARVRRAPVDQPVWVQPEHAQSEGGRACRPQTGAADRTVVGGVTHASGAPVWTGGGTIGCAPTHGPKGPPDGLKTPAQATGELVMSSGHVGGGVGGWTHATGGPVHTTGAGGTIAPSLHTSDRLAQRPMTEQCSGVQRRRIFF